MLFVHDTEEGHYTGGIVAFGYKRVKKGRLNKRNQEVCELEVNEEEAAIVRLIFQKYVYLFTWASTYKGASFERRQAILKQFIKEVRVGRDYNIEIVLNVPLDEFEEFKRHAASAGRGKNQKNKLQNPQKVGRCTSNAGIVVLDKTAGETVSIVPKNAAHAILRC